jgi:hypothetical protein
MIICSDNIAHDPPWRYIIMVREIRNGPVYVRIGSTDSFKMSPKRHQLIVNKDWSQAFGRKRYKTIQDALQALSDIKKNKYIFDARIHHLYYQKGAKKIR